MSTKIYNGFKFNTTDFNVINELLDKLKFMYSEVVEEEEKNVLHREMASYYDSLYLKDRITPEKTEEAKTSVYFKLMERFQEFEEKLQKGIRVPTFDFDFEVFLYASETETLGFYYCEQDIGHSIFKKFVKNNDIVEDYIYYNNTDKPEDISQEEWEKREAKWHYALDKIQLKVKLYSGTLYPMIDENCFPSLNKRAKRFKLQEYINEVKKVNEPTVPDVNEALDELIDNPELEKDIIKSVEKKLKDNLTLDDFMNFYVKGEV